MFLIEDNISKLLMKHQFLQMIKRYILIYEKIYKKFEGISNPKWFKNSMLGSTVKAMLEWWIANGWISMGEDLLATGLPHLASMCLPDRWYIFSNLPCWMSSKVRSTLYITSPGGPRGARERLTKLGRCHTHIGQDLFIDCTWLVEPVWWAVNRGLLCTSIILHIQW